MNRRVNILVTGCGGDIGQSIGKILLNADFVENLIGCDIHNYHPGKFIFKRCYIVPTCDQDDYFQKIEEILDQENIDVILPVSEPELRLYSIKEIPGNLFCRPVIMANHKAMSIGFDKLNTFNFLTSNSLPAPRTQILSQVDIPDYPLILKSRVGAGSKSMFYINDSNDFNFYKNKYPGFIAQEIVGHDFDEYTCCIFRSTFCETRSIIFKRILVGGYSGFGEVTENIEIRRLLNRISELIDLNGSINVQLRLVEKTPYVFEINPRFSSTVLFRHILGFKDLIWSIEQELFRKVSEYTSPKNGSKFYKGYSEFVEE